MTRFKFAAALSGLLLVLPLLGVTARAEDNSPQSYVVLIGISDYADKQIKPRPMAENDAKALYDLFTNKSFLGVEEDHVRLLLGKPDEKRKEPARHPGKHFESRSMASWAGKQQKGRPGHFCLCGRRGAAPAIKPAACAIWRSIRSWRSELRQLSRRAK